MALPISFDNALYFNDTSNFTNYAYINTESYLPPIPEVTVPGESSSSGSWFSLDSLQFGLDALGFVPGPAGMIADLANAGIHVVRGNFSEAGWSVIGFVPGIGDSLKGAHTLKKTADVTAGAISQGGKLGSDMANVGKTTANGAQSTVKNIERKCKNGLEGQCFTEGTQIVVGEIYDEELCTTIYVTENIEDIAVGDLVYSYDTVTGQVVQSQVTETFALESDHINYLTIVDEDSDEQVIETTDSHPFWVVTDEPDLERAAREIVNENGVTLYHENLESNLNGYWVEAKDLQEGDVFLGANGELSTLIVTERVVFPEGVKVYNFTVDGNHNYFVIAETDEFGQTSILVHNSSCVRLASELPIVKKGTKEWAQAIQDMRVGKVDVRVSSASDAKNLLKEAHGNMNRYKQYTRTVYKKGFEMHQQFRKTEGRALGNDLPHIKWKNDQIKGHIFFDVPN